MNVIASALPWHRPPGQVCEAIHSHWETASPKARSDIGAQKMAADASAPKELQELGRVLQ
ncbi:MAG: hypothetical protein DPW18_15455 [Chloroflexi bacterium]|nr:hypothetical protein [Chloroflexota bacterium]